MNRFEKNMKVDAGFNTANIGREEVRLMGEAFVKALVDTFDEYIMESHKLRSKNPNLDALKKTVNDLNVYGQAMMEKYGGIFTKTSLR